VNYDLDYERLKGEMGKLGDIDAEIVESLATKILTEKSKDVRVLAFLAFSMLKQGDFGRMVDAICALTAFCQDGFEQIYPRRDSAKASALRWFSEARFGGQCEKVTVTAADAQNAERLVDAFSKLRVVLEKRFSDSTPPLSILYKRAADWKKSAESAAKPAPAAEQPSNVGGAVSGIRSDNGSSSVDRQTKTVDGDEYQEVLQCIKKIETFILNLKNGAVV
jgi:type VI secretion system protein VasJ